MKCFGLPTGTYANLLVSAILLHVLMHCDRPAAAFLARTSSTLPWIHYQGENSLRVVRRRRQRNTCTRLEATQKKTNNKDKTENNVAESSQQPIPVVGVVAPLLRIGPYTCLRLLFSNWEGGSKDEKGFDFLIDTGANVNSIHSDLVKKYGLPEVSFPIPDDNNSILSQPSLIGATTSNYTNSQKAGTIHVLGDCALAGLPGPPRTFLRNLTAASLPLPSPSGGAGLLGLPFLWSFPAGVEFDWHGTDGDPPTMVFYFGDQIPLEAAKMESMVRIPLQVLMGGLLTLKITLDGIEMNALLDTGCPVTVLNDQACKLLGFAVDDATGHDKAVSIVGVDGSTSQLRQVDQQVSISIPSGDGRSVSLGHGRVWKGELAGIELIGRLLTAEGNNSLLPLSTTGEVSSADSSNAPAVVLGLDFLQNAYRMILRAPSQELWLEELPTGFDRKYA